MFGLKNYGGSCWLNSCIQSIFRIPGIKSRYTNLDSEMALNPIDKSLSRIWKSNGQEGLKELFDAINEQSKNNAAYEMLAGRNIGDANEAFIYFCDTLPFLDLLCRYNIVEKIKCKCGYEQEKTDSHIQFEIYPKEASSLITCISDAVKPEILDSWKCDKCSERGHASKQIIMKSFPTVLVFKILSNQPVTYSNILVINSNRYQLCSLTSYNGGHWWAYAKEDSWVILDDTRVRQLRLNEVPSSQNTKMLIYYRIN